MASLFDFLAIKSYIFGKFRNVEDRNLSDARVYLYIFLSVRFFCEPPEDVWNIHGDGCQLGFRTAGALLWSARLFGLCPCVTPSYRRFDVRPGSVGIIYVCVKENPRQFLLALDLQSTFLLRGRSFLPTGSNLYPQRAGAKKLLPGVGTSGSMVLSSDGMLQPLVVPCRLAFRPSAVPCGSLICANSSNRVISLNAGRPVIVLIAFRFRTTGGSVPVAFVEPQVVVTIHRLFSKKCSAECAEGFLLSSPTISR